MSISVNYMSYTQQILYTKDVGAVVFRDKVVVEDPSPKL